MDKKKPDKKQLYLRWIVTVRKSYSGEFKAKVVLEILKEEKTISQIAK